MFNMTNANINTLINLAKVNQVKDDLSIHLNEVSYVPEELKAMFQEAEADSKKEAMRNAVDSIRSILAAANEVKQQSVQAIRSVRLTEKLYLSKLEKIDRALQYGAETMNYVPLAVVLELARGDHVVPENWKPKAPVKKAAAK